MGRVLSRDERIRLWSALSDVFVDNSVDYASIARKVRDFERVTVERAFFEDVAPACHSNLQTPVPPIWTAFDSAWLATTIDNLHRARNASALRHLLDSAGIAYLRYRLKSEWQEIVKHLDRADSEISQADQDAPHS